MGSAGSKRVPAASKAIQRFSWAGMLVGDFAEVEAVWGGGEGGFPVGEVWGLVEEEGEVV